MGWIGNTETVDCSRVESTAFYPWHPGDYITSFRSSNSRGRFGGSVRRDPPHEYRNCRIIPPLASRPLLLPTLYPTPESVRLVKRTLVPVAFD